MSMTRTLVLSALRSRARVRASTLASLLRSLARGRASTLVAALSACDQFASVGVLEAGDAQVPRDASDASLDGSFPELRTIQECGAMNSGGFSADEVAAARAGGSVAEG